MDAAEPLELDPGERRIVGVDDEPARDAGVAEERLHRRPLDRDLAHPERPVEDRARQVGRRGSRHVAAIEDPDVEPGRRGRAPRREPGLALDPIEQVERWWTAALEPGRAGRTRIASPARTTPSRSTRAYIRESVGWSRIEIRPDFPAVNAPLMTSHGLAGPEISRTTSSPIASRAPTSSSDSSIPAVVRFSPTDPGPTPGWPSARTRSIASLARRQTARCGPPWTVSWWWASPSSPSRPTRASPTGSFGTPPADTLTWTTRPTPEPGVDSDAAAARARSSRAKPDRLELGLGQRLVPSRARSHRVDPGCG